MSEPHTAHQEIRRLQTILDASTDCIKVLDLDARLLSMNAGGMTTMEIEDFRSCSNLLWSEFWEGEYRQQVETGLQAARMGQTFAFVGQANTFAGTPKWWEVQISPLRDQEGEITQLLAVSRDITARKVAERRVQEQDAEFQALRMLTLERQVSENERALQAFVRFTTAVASNTDLEVLAAAALSTVREVLGDVVSGFYLVRGEVALPLAFSSNTPPDLQVACRATGFSLQHPVVAEALGQPGFAFTGQMEDQCQSEPSLAGLGVRAYCASGQPYALLVLGSGRSTWTAQERAITESVGQALGLALDRSDAIRQLQEQNAELESRNRALAAFSQLTEVLDIRADRYALVRRAQELALSLLPPGHASYFEPEDGLWHLRSQAGDAGLPALQRALEAGLPVGATPTLDRVMRAREPHFAEVDAGSATISGEFAGHLNAVACLPILIRGEFWGVFTVPLLGTRTWSDTDRAVLLSVVQGLTLALEGAQSVSELAARTLELERSNQHLLIANEELGAFSYSASHDLRTPVRHAMGFAELARTHLKQGQYDRVGHDLDVIKQSSLRMTALIDGMLRLSQAANQELHVQWVDLSALVVQAQRDVAVEFAGHPVDWRVGPLPRVQADPGMLQQVLTNLLSNAVKYSGRQDVSVVTIQAEETPLEWRVSVQDNGVGFNPKYEQRLFGIFQRLHSDREFGGTGVGLATVRRIILKHGGLVFARSQNAAGATFGFTLPKR